MNTLTAQLEQAVQQASTAKHDQVRASTELERIQAALQTSREQARQQTALSEQLSGQLEEQRRDKTRAEAQQQHLAGQIAQLEEQLRQLAGADDDFLRRRSELSEQLSQTQLEHLSTQKDLDMNRSALEQLDTRHKESHARMHQLEENIQRLEGENKTHQQEIETIHTTKAQQLERIAQLEQSIQDAVALRMEKEGSISQQMQHQRRVADDREKMSQEIARLNERKAGAEKEYD